MKNLIKRLLKEYATYEDVMDILTGKKNDIKTVGIITAWNPKTTKIEEKESKRRQLKLKKELRQSGYNYIDISGQFQIFEESILVLNIPKSHLIELGSDEKFNQTSVIYGIKVGRKMVYEYIEGDIVVQRMNVVLGNENQMVKALTDFYSIIKEKRFKIPFFTDEFSYPEEEYTKDLLKSKNITIDDIESQYLKIIDKMLNKKISPLKYEKYKLIVDLFLKEKGIEFVKKEYDKLSQMGMPSQNLKLIFNEYEI